MQEDGDGNTGWLCKDCVHKEEVCPKCKTSLKICPMKNNMEMEGIITK